jgi:hypothetical protein
MSNPLYYKIKDTVETDKRLLVNLFFRDWIDGVCDSRVKFITSPSETSMVDFDSQEDALAIRLQGLPPKLQMYVEIVN